MYAFSELKNVMKIEQIIKKQLDSCDPSQYHFIESTDWLEDIAESEIERLYTEYCEKAQNLIDEVSETKGHPTFFTKNDDFFKDWYPEAFFAAAWQEDDKYLFVAAEHHDRETPISLVLGAVTNSCIEGLRV